MPAETESSIEKLLRSEGVTDFAFLDLPLCDAGELETRTASYSEWTAGGFHGGMKYLEGHGALKYFPDRILPGARGLILMIFPYFQGGDFPEIDSSRGRVARYAWGRDYHKVIGKKLNTLARTLSGHFPGENFRSFVDAGPLDERYFAWKAGLGSPGTHGLLITPRYGSWVFIGEIITTKKIFSQQEGSYFAEKKAAPGTGTVCPPACTLCRKACPTGALGPEGLFDARRCISYLTIEHRGPVPEHLRSLIGDRFFGCDECQQICPFNRDSLHTDEPGFFQHIAGKSVDIREILRIRSHPGMVDRFAGSPVMRLGPEGLLRNALTVAGNSRDLSLRPEVRELVSHADPAVKEHARWALRQLS